MCILTSYLCDIIHEQTGRYPTAIEDDPYIVGLVAKRVIDKMPASTNKRILLQFAYCLMEMANGQKRHKKATKA